MNDRDVLVELQQQHGIRVKLEDGCELPGWAERMIANALRQPDFRATVAAALDALRARVAHLPVSDFSIDLVRLDAVLSELSAAITKLGLGGTEESQ